MAGAYRWRSGGVAGRADLLAVPAAWREKPVAPDAAARTLPAEADYRPDRSDLRRWGCRRGDDEGRVRPSRRDGADPVAELRQCRGVGRDAGLVAELCLAARSRQIGRAHV